MSEGKGVYSATLADAETVGGVLKVLNPESEDLIIPAGQFILKITTVATAACTLDAGIDDGGDVSDDGLLDGVDAHSAEALFSNSSAIDWPSGEYLVVSMATGAAAGLEGTAYVGYIRA